MKNEERLFRYILSFLVTAILTFTFVPNIHHYLMPDGPITKTDKGGLSFRFNEICNKWSDKTLEKMNPFLQLFAIIILIILFFIIYVPILFFLLIVDILECAYIFSFSLLAFSGWLVGWHMIYHILYKIVIKSVYHFFILGGLATTKRSDVKGVANMGEPGLPDSLNEDQILTQLRLYHSNERLLTSYMKELMIRYHLDTEIKTLERLIGYLDIRKDVFLKAKEAALAEHEFKNIDKEKEIMDKEQALRSEKLDGEIEDLQDDREIKKMEKRFEIAKLQKEIDELENPKPKPKQVDPIVGVIEQIKNKVITIEEAKAEINKKLSAQGATEEQIERALDEFDAQMAQSGLKNDGMWENGTR